MKPSDKKPHGLTGRASNRTGKGLKAPTATRSIRLPIWLWERIEESAEANGQSVNAFIADALSIMALTTEQNQTTP